MSVTNILHVDAPLYLSGHITASRQGGADDFATGSLWMFGDRVFLVTNWHVVTGGDWTRPEREVRVPPETLRFEIPLPSGPSDTEHVEVPLFDAEGPTWIEHPEIFMDVVAIELPDTEVAKLRKVPNGHATMFLDGKVETDVEGSDGKAEQVEIVPEVVVGGRLLLPGYATGFVGVGGRPVVMTAYAASEVGTPTGLTFKDSKFTFNETTAIEYPAFLTHSETTGGMSGTPVLHQVLGGDRVTRKGDGRSYLARTHCVRVVGVHSGQLRAPVRGSDSPRTEVAHVGVVWKTEAVLEIIRRGKQGSSTNVHV